MLSRRSTERFRILHQLGLEDFSFGAALELGRFDGAALREPGYVFFDNPKVRIEQPLEIRESLAALNFNYYVPCRLRGRAVAWFGLGRTRGGHYLTSDDLTLVKTVAGYFAIALENARLYHSLERKAAQYQQLKDYNAAVPIYEDESAAYEKAGDALRRSIDTMQAQMALGKDVAASLLPKKPEKES